MIHSALVNRIADDLLGLERRDWAAEYFPRIATADSGREAYARSMIAMRSSAALPAPLSAFAGRYDHPVFGPIIVRQERQGLSLQMGEGQIADLEYHGDSTFFTVWRDPFFREYFPAHVNFAIENGTVVSLSTLLNRDQFTATKATRSR
jgi:hypothetical protein